MAARTLAGAVVWIGENVRARSAAALIRSDAVRLAADAHDTTPEAIAAAVVAWRISFHRITGEWPNGHMAPTPEGA